jgi:hypothetical protein
VRRAARPIEKESVHKLCEKKAMIKLLLFCVSHPFITSLPPLFRRERAPRRDAFSALSVRIQRRWNYENKQHTHKRDLLAAKMLFQFLKGIGNK